MRPRKKAKIARVPWEPVPCFSCGGVMRQPDQFTGVCDACEVMEEPGHASLLRLREGSWWGSPVTYIDHAIENHPSPA